MAGSLSSLHGEQLHAHLPTARRVLKRWTSATSLLFFTFLLFGAFVYIIDNLFANFLITKRLENSFSLNYSGERETTTCNCNHYPTALETYESSDAACPEYFRWIHDDLRPWKSTGITKDMVERAKEFASFRLIIIKGKAYVERYKKSFQTRDLFTIWGILQLLRLYPGKLPDLDVMFWCGDKPKVLKHDHATSPPALFQYCGRQDSLGIIFPDWSFWGWGELSIEPWKNMLARLIESNKKIKWKSRVPYAYWKGNPAVSTNREELMMCNVSDKHEWNARLYSQNWFKEKMQGFKDSKLEDQCTHRYKIYVEGRGWSVSNKYILSCDSMTLLIKPRYYDFYMRSMVPMQHYWPISSKNKCRDIKFAVEWGNSHPDKAQAIGKAGSRFIQENLKMENIYAYMYHSLREYANLLKFKPEIPEGRAEICPELIASQEGGLWRKFMLGSMVKSPSNTLPCTMPSPLDPSALKALFERNENITTQVTMWEQEYWENLPPDHH